MNWQTFLINNLSHEKAFESLCNQLFENWCHETYLDNISYFTVNNGAGGDGGVESYAILKDDSIVGLQAKWFPNVIEASHIIQIKNSIQTALKIRPKIKKYIVCVPRNLASMTGRNVEGGDYEEKRWLTLVAEIKKQYPELELVLWNDHVLTKELEKPTSVGISRYWFHNTEISYDKLIYAFEKSKESWLHTKYVPELNCYGKVYKTIINSLGDFEVYKQLHEAFVKVNLLAKRINKPALDLINIIKDEDDNACKIKEFIKDLIVNADALIQATDQLIKHLENDSFIVENLSHKPFTLDFNTIEESLRRDSYFSKRYWHTNALTPILNELANFDLYDLYDQYSKITSKNNIIFKGNPGTGKSHGVASSIEKLLLDKYHAGIIVQARDIEPYKTWKDIVLSNLGLSSNWEEDELWQALISMVNINKIDSKNISNEPFRILPKVLIVVDGIDESSTKDKWEERVRETCVISAKYPQIRFCITTRPFLFKKRILDVDEIYLHFSDDVKVSEMFDKYIKYYSISVSNSRLLKESLTTPLALKLFCELNQGRSFDFDDSYDVSLPQLLGKKIELIEIEFSKHAKVDVKNQYVLKAIKELTVHFFANETIEREDLITLFELKLSTDKNISSSLINYLSDYGVLYCYCEHGNLFSGNKYYYSPGIRSYFDHASTVMILEKYKTPELINFCEYNNLSENTLYGIATVSIRKYGYLITQNETLRKKVNNFNLEEIQYWALVNCPAEAAEKFKHTLIEKMRQSSSLLHTAVNQVILPLARKTNHPLGVKLLDELLLSFEKPAMRDEIWAQTGYLRDSYGKKWDRSVSLHILEDYPLTEDDKFDGLPIIYAWCLSSLNNTLRNEYRKKLMNWAIIQPYEFMQLFYKFSNVNDLQILNELYSILMCVAYETNNEQFIKDAYYWVSKNVLAEDKIDSNRSVSIRYYSIAIIYKAIELKLCEKNDATRFLPPYSSSNYTIKLDKDALSGTRMGGYSGIHYDLSRYVLIDRIQGDFNHYNQNDKKQIDNFLLNVKKNLKGIKHLSFEQFVLSAAYAFVIEMGWDEKIFQNHCKDSDTGKSIGGIDSSILGTYFHADHGAQSKVMSVCEKYVWLARDYIYGFLSDRLNYSDTNEKILDYGMLQDFTIPMQEVNQVNPDDIPKENPWHIPEQDKLLASLSCYNKEDVVESIKESPDINWMDWICVKNNDRYKIKEKELLALYCFCCFEMTHAETCLFINSIIIDKSSITSFVNHILENNNYTKIHSVDDLSGGIEADCYITPKECCWFNWKKHYEPYGLEDFNSFNLLCATDKGCWSHNEFGDIYYRMPSPFVRSMLEINDSDGYLFFDSSKQIQAERTIAGKTHHTYQEYLFVDKERFLNKLESENKTILWITKEYRRETGLSKEKFGDFYIDKNILSVGYFEDDKFVTLNLNKSIETNA